MVGWHHQLNAHEFEQTSGDAEGQGSLACYSPWAHKKLNMTEWLNNNGNNRFFFFKRQSLIPFPLSWTTLNNSILLSRIKQKWWYVTILGPVGTEILPCSLGSLALGEASCHIMRTFKTALWEEPHGKDPRPPANNRVNGLPCVNLPAPVKVWDDCKHTNWCLHNHEKPELEPSW